MPFPVVDGLRAIEFGTPGEIRRLLVDLVVNDNKRATAELLSEYETEHEPLEHVGERLAIVDDDGRRVATVRVTDVVVSRFADVPDRFALAEAEGDLTAEDFRASHTKYWSSVGTPVTDDTLIVQLYFELLAGERSSWSRLAAGMGRPRSRHYERRYGAAGDRGTPAESGRASQQI